jgi:hypothetical protein
VGHIANPHGRNDELYRSEIKEFRGAAKRYPQHLLGLADEKRSVEPGEYTVFVGGTQPDQNSGGTSQGFTITGRKELPR